MEESSDVYAFNINNPDSCEDHQPQTLEDLLEVDRLRRKIKYYFMNPCEKYHARGRKPWKLVLQIIKIAIITIQLVSFGLSNQMVVTFKEENLMAFQHLFLKDYADGGTETFALYKQADVYHHIEYIITQYGLLHNNTVGNLEYERNGSFYTPLSLCQAFYRNGSIDPGTETFEIDAQVEIECLEIYPMQSLLPRDSLQNLKLYFKRMLSVTITFVLKGVNLQTVQHLELPDCYDFTVLITFNNYAHSGRIKVDLDADVYINECNEWKVHGASAKNLYLTVLFDCVIIVTCITSLVLCTRSVIKGILLMFTEGLDSPLLRSDSLLEAWPLLKFKMIGSEYVHHCRKNCGKDVPWSDRFEFVSGWYILIIISDTLTIVGSILKIEIQTKVLTSYDVCSIFLGTGTMLVWIGVIRYMGYFRKYNILIVTLRTAFPNVIRFICCAGIIYLSYLLCGWIVIGPYHEKFRSLNTGSECLFSLINGDDMFPTFKNMKQKSSLVWVFSRVYIYTFVSLFIYMILSLFITIITDTYDTIKQQQQSGVPTSELQKFLSVCTDLPKSGAFRLDKTTGCLIACCIDRCKRSHERLTSDA